MAKFDVKNYKLDKTSLKRLNRLTTAHLSEVLKYWSRIGNQRASRMKKLDPFYSGVFEYSRGGRFGKHEAYKDRDTILNELYRVRNVGQKLKTKNLKAEQQEMKRAYAEIQKKVNKVKDTKAKIKSKGLKSEKTISYDAFRKGFAIFKSKYKYIDPEFYERAKNAIMNMADRDYTVVNIADLIDNLWGEYQSSMIEQPDSSNPFSVDEIDGPW